jgi:hypothetical protein
MTTLDKLAAKFSEMTEPKLTVRLPQAMRSEIRTSFPGAGEAADLLQYGPKIQLEKGILLNRLEILWWTLFFIAIFFQMCTIPLYSWNWAPPLP